MMHGCWWPGDTRSQGISNLDNNLFFGYNSRQVPLFCCMLLYQVAFTDVTMLINPWIACYITKQNNEINSMASGRCGSNRKNVIWEIISCRLFAKLLSGECPNFFGDESTLVKVMAWCHLARARPAVPLGLWSITSSLRGNFYVPRLHKFIKWFADNDVAHRN